MDTTPPGIMPPGYTKLLTYDLSGETALDMACTAKDGGDGSSQSMPIAA